MTVELSTLGEVVKTAYEAEENTNALTDTLLGLINSALQPMTLNAELTAYATGGQANAIQLLAGVNVITTCVTSGDSAKLPTAVTKTVCIVHNRGDERVDLYPNTDDEIEYFGVNNPVVLNTQGTIHLLAIDDATWIQI